MSLVEILMDNFALSQERRQYAYSLVKNVHRKEPYDVYIGRPGKGHESRFGNPFSFESEGHKDRELLILKFLGHVQRERLWEHIPELLDKTLGCFCAPDSCHGHALAELAEASRDSGTCRPLLNILIMQLVEKRLFEARPLIGAVSGSRHMRDPRLIHAALSQTPWYWSELHHGDCVGTDKLADLWAKALRLNSVPHTVEWHDDTGKLRAERGPLRNRVMIDRADAFVAFWDGKTEKSGTLDFLSAPCKSKDWIYWSLPVDHAQICAVYYGIRERVLDEYVMVK